MMSMEKNIIELKNLTKTYILNKQEIIGIKNINLKFKCGKLHAIVGHSGSGKSTLLQIIGLLKDKTTGTYKLLGQDIDKMNGIEKAKLRNKHIGFIFQDFYLDEDINALENIMLPYYISHERNYSFKKNQVIENFKLLGIEGKEKNRPKELSSGQNAKVAFMRALVNDPEIILADEPTGNLDQENENLILDLLKKLANEGKCVIVVSHSPKIKEYADVVISIEEGNATYEK